MGLMVRTMTDDGQLLVNEDVVRQLRKEMNTDGYEWVEFTVEDYPTERYLYAQHRDKATATILVETPEWSKQVEVTMGLSSYDTVQGAVYHVEWFRTESPPEPIPFIDTSLACDNCDVPVSAGRRNNVPSLPVDAMHANEGETATLCNGCKQYVEPHL